MSCDQVELDSSAVYQIAATCAAGALHLQGPWGGKGMWVPANRQATYEHYGHRPHMAPTSETAARHFEWTVLAHHWDRTKCRLDRDDIRRITAVLDEADRRRSAWQTRTQPGGAGECGSAGAGHQR